MGYADPGDYGERPGNNSAGLGCAFDAGSQKTSGKGLPEFRKM
jgi:hypothetical protein